MATEQEADEIIGDIEELIGKTRKKYPYLREGQTFFNILSEACPPLAEEIQGTPLDPFYNDDLIPSVKVWLKKKLTEPNPTEPSSGS